MRHWPWLAGVLTLGLICATYLLAQSQMTLRLLMVLVTGGTVRLSPCIYKYVADGQLTNEIADTVTNLWPYDEAGNRPNAGPTSAWVYDADNELLGQMTEGVSCGCVRVKGQVEPGACSNKWVSSTAECRGVRGQVNPSDGTFSLLDVPLSAGV